MRVTITDPAINRAKRECESEKVRRELSDNGKGGVPGLRLRIGPSGSPAWVLGCRDREGRMRRFPLGQWPALGLAEAREAARTMRYRVKHDAADPIADARKARATAKDAKAGIGTLEALLDRYGAVRGRKLRSWGDCRRQISNVFKAQMTRPVAALMKIDLQTAAVMHSSDQAAAAAVRYIRPVIKWGAELGLIDADLAALKPHVKVVKRDRVLTDAELAAIWHATDANGIPATFGRLVKLMILTGQRREEVAAMAWSEVSADRSMWTIAGARSKNAQAHAVPLCRAVQDLLPAECGGGLIFPGLKGTAFAGWSKAKNALDTASGVMGWRLHDLRRSVATGLQRLGVRFEVTEAVLGHVSGSRSGVAGIYQRHEWINEKRAALAGWAAEVARIVDGKASAPNVVLMQRAG